MHESRGEVPLHHLLGIPGSPPKSITWGRVPQVPQEMAPWHLIPSTREYFTQVDLDRDNGRSLYLAQVNIY